MGSKKRILIGDIAALRHAGMPEQGLHHCDSCHDEMDEGYTTGVEFIFADGTIATLLCCSVADAIENEAEK